MSDRQVDLQQPVGITLPLGAWNTLLGIIAKSRDFPWEVTDPLIQVIRQQLQQAMKDKEEEHLPRRPRMVDEAS